MTVARTTTFILSVFIVGMVEMMVAGIMNLMSQDLHVSEAVVGQLVTLYALTFAICGPLLVKIDSSVFFAISIIMDVNCLYLREWYDCHCASFWNNSCRTYFIFCRFTHYCESFSTHSAMLTSAKTEVK